HFQRGVDRQPGTRLYPLQHGTGFLGAPLAYQKAHRLGQIAQDHRQQQQRHYGCEEHHFPTEARQQEDTQTGGTHAAQRITAEHDGYKGTAQLLRRVLIHQRHHVGHQPTAAQSGEKAEDAEFRGGTGEAVGYRGDTEQRKTDDDALLAADVISQGAEQQRADRHAEQRETAHRTGLQRRQTPRFDDHRQFHAVDEQIVAVED